jgi:hypothetical protein
MKRMKKQQNNNPGPSWQRQARQGSYDVFHLSGYEIMRATAVQHRASTLGQLMCLAIIRQKPPRRRDDRQRLSFSPGVLEEYFGRTAPQRNNRSPGNTGIVIGGIRVMPMPATEEGLESEIRVSIPTRPQIMSFTDVALRNCAEYMAELRDNEDRRLARFYSERRGEWERSAEPRGSSYITMHPFISGMPPAVEAMDHPRSPEVEMEAAERRALREAGVKANYCGVPFVRMGGEEQTPITQARIDSAFGQSSRAQSLGQNARALANALRRQGKHEAAAKIERFLEDAADEGK